MARFLLLVGAVIVGAVICVLAGPEIKKADEALWRKRAKAKKFLKDQLPAELWIEYEQNKRLVIKSKTRSGRTYELKIDGSVSLVDNNGQSKKHLCVQTPGDLPVEDRMLTIVRNIQANEKDFLRSIGQPA